MKSKQPLQFIALMGMAAIMAPLTLIVGALPMRVARRSYGRLPFWLGFLLLSGALLAGGFAAYAAVIFTVTILVGVYCEVEEHGGSIFVSGSVATLASAGAIGLAMTLWLRKMGLSLLPVLRTELQPLVDRMATVNAPSPVTIDAVLQTLPSGTLIALLVAIAIMLIWESPLRHVLRLPPILPPPQKLLDFRVPDLTVWLVMVAILGAFVNHGSKITEIIAMNALYLFALLYFFQGFAIVVQAFRVFRIAPFWRGIWYVVIVLQLFLMVSVIGYADFWLDFRERFKKLPRKPAQEHN